ncbi:MFS transporter [Zhongshania sp.]|uniref:MFS transporter n=1 Tax=Zhongshania sp. TaxID=1971902 RepID=UPI0035674C55
MSEHIDPPTDFRSDTPYPAPSVAWYATLLLAFLYWLSILDRFIISLLVEPIKRDMGISDLQFGLLHGAAFAITYSLFGLIAGALADRFPRRWIIFVSVAAWSMATAACGMAQNFWHLLIARVGVGMGEAGLNPSATSMLTDLFPRSRLTSAMAVYSMGATVGSGTAYLLGGAIVELVSKSETFSIPLIGAIPSWQAVFFIIGVPGVFLSLLIFTLPEPLRRDRSNIKQSSGFWKSIYEAYKNLIQFIRTQSRFFAHHYSGFMFASAVMGGCGVWYPAHMARTFAWSSSEIGLSLGITLVAAGILGKFICGFAVDTMYSKGYRDGQFRWYACCLVLATPFGILATTTANPVIFLSCVAVFLALLAPLPACYVASLNLVTPNELRGTGIAFFAGTAGLIGIGAGPIIVAGIGESLFAGSNTIGAGMATTIAIFCPIAAVLLATGCKSMRTAVNAAES